MFLLLSLMINAATTTHQKTSALQSVESPLVYYALKLKKVTA